MPNNTQRADARRRDGIIARELALMEKDLIEDALAFCQGNKVKACDLIGMDRVALWKRIPVLGIDVDDIKRQSETGQWVYKTAPDGAPWSESGEGAEW